MLKRVRIKGFKSCADPIDLEFGPGINVIVGPNGAGKSNIAEAIVWALGEQRAGRLRAPAMQDILFSGGDGRQPVGMAEVSITVDGPVTDGGPAELGVTRRLTRAGDSGYKLNNGNCRLVDVLDSLSSRGLGPQSLAIIRQGQVDQICQSTPAALRGILDETAGTGLPKRRRHRAELRLKHVDDHLARARDLSTEITSRARALERQARAAERAGEVERELHEARAALATARTLCAGRELAAARDVRTARRAQVTTATQTLKAAHVAARAADEQRQVVITERENAMQSAGRVRGVAERLAGRSEVATGRVQLAHDDAERRRVGRREAQAALVVTERGHEEAEAGLTAADAASRGAADRLEQAEAADQAALASLERARDDRRMAERDAAERATAEGRVVRATEAMAGLYGAGVTDVARAERRAEISSLRRTRDQERLAQARRRAETARSACEGAAARAARLAAEAASLAPGEDRPVEGVLLGDGIEVEKGMERAVAAALGELADAPIVHTFGEGATALEAGALAAAVVRPAAPQSEDVPPTAGARRLSSVITSCPDRARPWLDGLLAGAWLVPSLEGLPANIRARVLVTADGLAFSPALGMLTGVRGPWAGRVLHRHAVASADAAAAMVKQAEVTERALADGERRTGVRARASERSGERGGSRLESARAEARRRDAARADAVAALDVAHAELVRLGAAPEGAPGHPEADGESARAARIARTAARETARMCEQDAAQRRAVLQDIVARRARARAEAEAPEAALVDHGTVLAAARAMDAVAQALKPCGDAMDQRARELATFLAEIGTALQQAQQAVDVAERVTTAAAESDRAAEIAMAVAAERAREAGVAEDAPPSAPPAQDEEHADAIAERVQALVARREAMGAVNPLASQERAALAAREGETEEQIADLQKAAEALRAQMAELDAQVAGAFAEVMQAVDERFQEVVGLLFPGGTGRLRVVDDEGDEGVEIEVVPAGKRARSLALFSGGEKSLIALGFCLAIAMARPAPFYLLDEVEAGLDDTNLRRFLGVVRRLSGERQFILITHQQPTVEVADLLFGVTMGRSGVSQVVARRLDRNAEGPARPWVRRQLQAVSDPALLTEASDPPPAAAAAAG